MASRFAQQKPDPTLTRNIRRARRGQRTRELRLVMVGVSLAVTLGAAALVSHPDAQALTAESTTLHVAAPSLDLSNLAALPAALQSLGADVASGLQALVVTSPDPIARTRSSR